MTDKQLKIQEAIMIAIHGSLAQAKRNERSIVWCLYRCKRDKEILRRHWNEAYWWWVCNRDNYVIIWLPPTLSRVAAALSNTWCWYSISDWSIMTTDWWWRTREYVCDWELLNEDWSDATLFDQSEETQDAIYNLLCW